jgi:phosphoglycerate dehydrogenase-like enzyme
MPVTILYPEALYPDDSVEREVYGSEVRVVMRATTKLAELSDEDCAATDGLMILRQSVQPADYGRFKKLRAVVRMGVGYDRIDRKAAAAHNVMVCNVPDYGTTEVADHTMALVLALRRGLLLYHEAQRQKQPGWRHVETAMIQRMGEQRFGIVGMGRIGSAVALRAKAFGFKVFTFDPYQPNGVELALGVTRVRTLEDLLRQSDVLAIHAPLTAETKGMLGLAQLSLLPKGAVVVNTARGPILDLDALATLLRENHIAGAGIDVLPVEPPVEPVPELVRANRAREDWLVGRFIITPHAAFHSPHAWADIRRKSAETMRAALLGPRPQNVITPDMF